MKKKVCFLVDTIFTIGGFQRVVTLVANKLFSENYDVSIVCIKPEFQRDNSLYGLNSDIKVEFISTSNFEKILGIPGYIIKKFILKFPKLQKKTKLVAWSYYNKRFIRNKKIVDYINNNKIDDVIGVAPDLTMQLCLLKERQKIKAKAIGWQHSSCYSYFERAGYCKSLSYMFKEKLHFIEQYIVLTEYDKKWIKDNFDYNATCIYNPKSFYCKEKSNLDKKTFIAVGRYNEVKGFGRLIDSFKIFAEKNNDWNLFIVGEGELKEDLEKQINLLGLSDRVKLIPKTNDIKKYYLNASVYVLSSFLEGLPMVLIEACECGLPIISYDITCCVEQFSDCSLLVKNGDIEGFAMAMEELANNKKKLKELALKAKKNAQKYSIEDIILDWKKIL